MRFIRKALCILCIICILSLSPRIWILTSHAAEPIDPRPIVRVGYFDFERLMGTNETGGFTGYYYEYLEEIAAYTGWKYAFVYGSWEQNLDRLQRGDIDLVFSAQRTEEREAAFDFSRYEAGSESSVLLTTKDNEAIYYKDYDSFDNLRVGLMRGNFQNQLLEEFALEHSFFYSSEVYSTSTEATAAMLAGTVDAVLASSLHEPSNAKVIARFSPTPTYFITTKGNTLVLDGLNRAMEEIQTADPNYNTKLYDKYFGETAMGRLALTREEAQFVESHPVVRVAYNDSWEPIEYRDEKNLFFSGISASVMRRIETKSGLQFQYYPVRDVSEAMDLVSRGQADVISGFTHTQYRDAHRVGLMLTKPYIQIPVTLLFSSRRDFEGLGQIAIPQSSLLLEWYYKELFPGAQFVMFEDVEACLQAVKRNKADAVLENAYILDLYLKNPRYSGMDLLFTERISLPLCMAVSPRDSVALLSLLNKAISQLSHEELSDVILDNTVVESNAQLEAFFRTYALPVLILALLVVLLVIIRSRRKMEQYAFVDELTGRANQTRFLLGAQRLLQSRGSLGYAVASLDIDKFKLINNMHSYEVGNRVLRGVADVLERETDKTELFCRASNDNFLMLITGSGHAALEQRLRALLFQLVAVPKAMGVDFQYTMSCGVYQFGETDSDLHKAIGWANLARKSVKEQRINRVAFFDDSMREEILREQEIENRMESALTGHEFEVHYQPKFRLADEQPVGMEALVRWYPKDGAHLTPDEFIPVFEKNGFIIRLDLYIFTQVCAQLRTWLDQGMDPYPASVNLSRVHLGHPDFHKQYLSIMERYHIPASLIELELTESTIFENKEQMVTLMTELKKAGLTVSMDDFGTGYSSLNLLKDLPIDIVKLDREFFNTSADSSRGKKVIQSVVYMANQLGIEVIAEGVETIEQADFLRSIDCDYVQGYYYSKPLPADVFAKNYCRKQELPCE